MREHGGVIINVASVGGFMVEPMIGFYNVTKAAVIQLTRQLAYEMAPGVRVNAIAPGLVKTDMARGLWEGREPEQSPPHPAAPAGRDRRHRQRRGLPGQRRGVLDHRAHARRGRRRDDRAVGPRRGSLGQARAGQARRQRMGMDYQEIRYGPADGAGPQVVQVTLDRPAALNAYTSRMCEELNDALLRYARDEDARVLVLTGAGRAFCAGGDVASQVEVEEAARRQLGHGVVMRERMHLLVQSLYRMDKPLIAMINGPAVAGGLALALLCDFRVAAWSARLGDTSGRAGLLPDEGGAWLFPRVMGIAAATRMTLLSELYDASTAQQLGLVGEVVPDEQLRDRTMQLAGELAARAPLAVRVAKRMMRRSLELTFEQSLGDAEYAVNIVNDSEDVQEGVAAFLEKRAPVFRGR